MEEPIVAVSVSVNSCSVQRPKVIILSEVSHLDKFRRASKESVIQCQHPPAPLCLLERWSVMMTYDPANPLPAPARQICHRLGSLSSPKLDVSRGNCIRIKIEYEVNTTPFI